MNKDKPLAEWSLRELKELCGSDENDCFVCPFIKWCDSTCVPSRWDLEAKREQRMLERDDKLHDFKVDGLPLNLTPMEYKLLCLLAEGEGQVFTRQEIAEELYGHQDAKWVEPRNIDGIVSHLRNKLNPDDPYEFIRTRRGRGYYFEEE